MVYYFTANLDKLSGKILTGFSAFLIIISTLVFDFRRIDKLGTPGGERAHLFHCPQTIKIPDELHRIDRYIEKLKQETL